MSRPRPLLLACLAAFGASWAHAAGEAPKAASGKPSAKASRPAGEERKAVVAAFQRLLDLYRREDRDGFMSLVSPSFEGSRAALEDGVEKDFADFSGVDIIVSIGRVKRSGAAAEIEFAFTRRVESRTAGKTLTDKSKTRLSLALEDGRWLLKSMAEPAIFGVSAAREAATKTEREAQGEVLTVPEDGKPKLAPIRRK